MSVSITVPDGKRFDWKSDGNILGNISITKAGNITQFGLKRELYKRRVYAYFEYTASGAKLIDLEIAFFVQNRKDAMGIIPCRFATSQDSTFYWDRNHVAPWNFSAQYAALSSDTVSPSSHSPNAIGIKDYTDKLIILNPIEVEVEADYVELNLKKAMSSGSITAWALIINSGN